MQWNVEDVDSMHTIAKLMNSFALEDFHPKQAGGRISHLNGQHDIISNAYGNLFTQIWQFVWHFVCTLCIVNSKLKSCAKSANNACDISFKCV